MHSRSALLSSRSHVVFVARVRVDGIPAEFLKSFLGAGEREMAQSVGALAAFSGHRFESQHP